MILGVGVDVVDIKAFREQLADVSSVFVDGTFTAGEQASSRRGARDRTPHLAARFAAKEALIKAWSASSWGRAPILSRVDMRDIEVITDAFGRPAITLHGDVASAIESLGSVRCHLSMSHDGPIATAYVILEHILT